MARDWSLGTWIRRRRKALDLTQQELAARINCSAELISKIEADARRPSRQVAVLLAQHLALPPGEHEAFVRCARATLPIERLPPAIMNLPDSSPISSEPDYQAESARTNLPADLDTLVGRQAESHMLDNLLRQPGVRLVTLAGPGGVGKTRLGVRVAADSLAHFSDGAYLVDLAPLRDPALVARAIARTLGITTVADRPIEQAVAAYLRHKKMLLVLDNVEHLLPAALWIADLLAAAPRLVVLTTSRVVLRLSGEHVVPVAPLAVPVPSQLQAQHREAASVEQLMSFPAIQLFVERARAAQLDFALTPANAPDVATICVRLDGLPLAIELAAARLRLFAPAQLLAALQGSGSRGGSLDLLTAGARDRPERQQTLRRTIDWSYSLLDEKARALFARLSIFAGEWALDAATAICCWSEGGTDDTSPAQAGDMLETLIDSSLVVAFPGAHGTQRFRMLETIRDFAREHLVRSGEELLLRHRHTQYFLRLVEDAEHHLRGPGQQVWLARLDDAQDDLHAALARATSSDGQTRLDYNGDTVEMGLRLAGVLWYYWFLRGDMSGAWHWLERILPLGTHSSPYIRARALIGATFIAELTGARARAQALGSDADAAASACGDAGLRAFATALTAMRTSDSADARALFDESAMLAQRTGDRWLETFVLSHSAWMLVRLPGQQTEARGRTRAALERERVVGDPWLRGRTLWLGGSVAWQCGDYAGARALSEEALQISRTLGEQLGIAYALVSLTQVARNDGDYARARALQHERLAIEQTLDNQPGIASSLSMLGSLASEQGDYAQASALLAESLRLYEEQQEPAFAAALRLDMAVVDVERGRYAEAAHLSDVALVAAEALGERRLAVSARVMQARIALAQGTVEAAAAQLRACLGEDRRRGNLWGIADEVRLLGECAAHQGDQTTARRLLDESLSIARSLGSSWSLGEAHLTSGQAMLSMNESRDAEMHLLEGLRIFVRLGARARIASLVEHHAHIASARGAMSRAVRLWGAAATLRDAIGAVRRPLDHSVFTRNLATAQTDLDAETFATAWAEGEAMTQQQAVAYALEQHEARN